MYLLSMSQGKKLARTKRTNPKSVKSRLAGHLGIKNPPAGRSIPVVKGHRESGMEWQRQDSGAHSLSILGGDDLFTFRYGRQDQSQE